MTKINIKTMKTMLLNGTKLISNNFKYMDELNVFPVPDGDTGTNLKITVEGAAESIQNFDEGSDFLSFGKMYSRGLLMNARGNSGVILSQIFKGFVTDFAKEQKELTISDFCIAITNAKIKAYKSVATPVEGTILTVIRVVDEKLKEKSGSFVSFIDLIDFVCKEAEDILSKTPDFLPELKALNVVDSGGYGLCRFFEGMKKGIHGEQVVVSQDINEKKSKTNNASANFEKLAKKQVDSGFGYCTEFILKLKSKVVVEQEDKIDFDEQEFKKMINLHGDSIVYVKDDNIIKVHIHTINPWEVMKKSSVYGEYTKLKIENMTAQFLENNPGLALDDVIDASGNTNREDTTKIIATVPTETMGQLYCDQLLIKDSINCNKVGNPSVEQFLNEIKATNAKNAIIVTDNSNIIMAAKQAAGLIRKELCDVSVIPCKDIVSSYIVCLVFDPLLSHEENTKAMNKMLRTITVGKISKAVKRVMYSDKNLLVNIDDYIGLYDGGVRMANPDIQIIATKLLSSLFSMTKKPKGVTIIVGSNVRSNELSIIEKHIQENYNIKPNTIFGGKQTYNYYFAITK